MLYRESRIYAISMHKRIPHIVCWNTHTDGWKGMLPQHRENLMCTCTGSHTMPIFKYCAPHMQTVYTVRVLYTQCFLFTTFLNRISKFLHLLSALQLQSHLLFLYQPLALLYVLCARGLCMSFTIRSIQIYLVCVQFGENSSQFQFTWKFIGFLPLNFSLGTLDRRMNDIFNIILNATFQTGIILIITVIEQYILPQLFLFQNQTNLQLSHSIVFFRSGNVRRRILNRQQTETNLVQNTNRRGTSNTSCLRSRSRWVSVHFSRRNGNFSFFADDEKKGKKSFLEKKENSHWRISEFDFIATLEEEQRNHSEGSGNGNDKEPLTPKQRHQMKHRELFLSRQVETLPATQIRGKCSVTLLNETESMLSYLNKDVSVVWQIEFQFTHFQSIFMEFLLICSIFFHMIHSFKLLAKFRTFIEIFLFALLFTSCAHRTRFSIVWYSIRIKKRY